MDTTIKSTQDVLAFMAGNGAYSAEKLMALTLGEYCDRPALLELIANAEKLFMSSVLDEYGTLMRYPDSTPMSYIIDKLSGIEVVSCYTQDEITFRQRVAALLSELIGSEYCDDTLLLALQDKSGVVLSDDWVHIVHSIEAKLYSCHYKGYAFVTDVYYWNASGLMTVGDFVDRAAEQYWHWRAKLSNLA